MDYRAMAVRWLAANGREGKIIALRLYEDRFVVVLDSGPKVSIALADLEAMAAPEPETEPEPEPRPKRGPRSRRK